MLHVVEKVEEHVKSQLGADVVEFKKKSYSISRLKVLHVEELTSSELKKAACCNLGESFETNASVDVNMTDAVSGAKKIRMMGLEGIYTQIQVENMNLQWTLSPTQFLEQQTQQIKCFRKEEKQ